MFNNLFIFLVSLFMVVKGSTMATNYAGKLAKSFRLSKYTIGFVVVAFISVLPETFISISAAISGLPSFGLGILLSAIFINLTLTFALIIFLSRRNLKIESKVLRNNTIYPFILLLPLIFGINGHLSRLEGVVLLVVGVMFYCFLFKRGKNKVSLSYNKRDQAKNFAILLFSMALLLVGAHLAVMSATAFANYLGVSPILIGILIIAFGTTMPELFFSLKAVRQGDDSLAVGDVLGTVLADATIVIGLLTLISPFYFPVRIIYTTGLFVIWASFMLFQFLRSERILSKREAWMLLAFWLLFVLVELLANS